MAHKQHRLPATFSIAFTYEGQFTEPLFLYGTLEISLFHYTLSPLPYHFQVENVILQKW